MANDNPGFEESALARIAQMTEPMAEAAANVMGLPPGGKRYSEQDQLTMWAYSPIADPRIRVDTMLQLKSRGKTDEEITDAIYPERRRLIETSHPGIPERIRYAQDMERLMSKKAAEAGMPLPDPIMPMVESPATPAPMPTMETEAAPAPMPMQSAPAPIQPVPPPPSPAAPSPLDAPFLPLGG